MDNRVCFRRCQECLPGSSTQQAASSHLSYLWKVSQANPQSGATVGTRPGFWASPGLDPLPEPENHLSPQPEDSYRRVGAFRPQSAGHQEAGTLCVRACEGHDCPGGLPASGVGLENRQSYRREVSGRKVRANRLSRPLHPGHRRSLHPQRPPLSGCGSGLPYSIIPK